MIPQMIMFVAVGRFFIWIDAYQMPIRYKCLSGFQTAVKVFVRSDGYECQSYANIVCVFILHLFVALYDKTRQNATSVR